MIDLFEFAPAVLIQFSVTGEDVQFFHRPLKNNY
jgi:hypothetical protein